MPWERYAVLAAVFAIIVMGAMAGALFSCAAAIGSGGGSEGPDGEGGSILLVLEASPPDSPGGLPEGSPHFLRWRAVTLNPAAVGPGRVEKGDEIVLNLFPDARYVAQIDSVDENVMGVVTTQGGLESQQSGYMVITADRGDILVNIHIPEENKLFRIQKPAGKETAYLLELDPERLDVKESAPPLVPPDNNRGG